MMRYIDSSRRDAAHALGRWLEQVASDETRITDLRCQSGFFGAGALAYLAPLVASAGRSGGTLRMIVGSNDGETTQPDVEALFDLMSAGRTEVDLGVVRFRTSYFHPKVVHVRRADGSLTAYVGSANLTDAGLRARHIEAGLLLDSRVGDDPAVLTDIAGAIDRWFRADPPPGMYRVRDHQDIAELALREIIGQPRPARPAPPRPAGSRKGSELVDLVPLLKSAPRPDPPASRAGGSVARAGGPIAENAAWSKVLTRSDAQRKPSGNDRGSITLVRGRRHRDTQRYFRHDLFATAAWMSSSTRTRRPSEHADIEFDATVLGASLGTISLRVTYAAHREAAEGNYTSLLHLGPLAPHFRSQDMTGRLIRIDRTASGYSLAIE